MIRGNYHEMDEQALNRMPERVEETHRRYKKGVYPTYDAEYGKREISFILNAKNSAKSGFRPHTLSPDDPKNWYQQLQEQKEALSEKLEVATKESEEKRQSLLLRGELSADEAKIWLSDDVQKLQAALDIVIEEIEELEYRQKVEADKKKKADEQYQKAMADRKHEKGFGPVRAPLERGPEGRMVFKSDRVLSIDGQKVSYNKRGEPFIDDPASPYNGVLLYQYRREVVAPYVKAKQEAILKAKEEKLAQIKKLREEAAKPEVDVPLPLIVAGPHNRKRKNEEGISDGNGSI
jgi:hypothetical protein